MCDALGMRNEIILEVNAAGRCRLFAFVAGRSRNPMPKRGTGFQPLPPSCAPSQARHLCGGRDLPIDAVADASGADA